MILINIENALKTFFEDNMTELVGNGNYTIEIFKRKFPDNSQAEGLSIFVELRNSMNVYELEPTAVRVNVRTQDLTQTSILMHNADLLIDRHVNLMLDNEIMLCTCIRNAGPEPFDDVGDGLCYESTLYNAKFMKVT